MSKLHRYFILILSILCLIIVLQNMATVSISFLFWEFAIPRAILIGLMLIIGLIIGLIIKSKRK
ncbi:MAG: lipopolysaccharide assembly protein LapA domain-containing protein [Colwellia polaris]|jgi:putative membrane protein